MRKTSMTDHRLEQDADYLCTIELAALKYATKEDGGTCNRFFGGIGAFKKAGSNRQEGKGCVRVTRGARSSSRGGEARYLSQGPFLSRQACRPLPAICAGNRQPLIHP